MGPSAAPMLLPARGIDSSQLFAVRLRIWTALARIPAGVISVGLIIGAFWLTGGLAATGFWFSALVRIPLAIVLVPFQLILPMLVLFV
ncbi:MAG TPA: hypothetical protein VJ935_12270, partial [Acidimicrobiia bacterium]|nr:hypothetical protein [Acidimicrobiia bacterium]